MSKKGKRLLYIAGGFLACLAALSLFFRYQTQRTQTILHLTQAQKLADFDTLCSILEQAYPFWAEAEQMGIRRQEAYEDCRAAIASADTDIAYCKALDAFLGEFQGLGHLSLLDGAMYRQYGDALRAGQSLLTAQERAGLEPIVRLLRSEAVQHTYSLLDQSHSGFRSTIGLKESYLEEQPAQEEAAPAPAITTAIYAGGRAAYVKIPSFSLEYYAQAQETLAAFFAEIQSIPHLIVDIRGNGGGSDRFWQDLLVSPNAKTALVSERYFLFNLNAWTEEYAAANSLLPQPCSQLPEGLQKEYGQRFSHYALDVTAFGAAPTPYPGRIWLLVDEGVYSAAENLAMFCKNTGFATLVGTATGGDGGMADPMLFSLPNSGLVVRFSIFYGLNADGSGNEANGTSPDILLPQGADALESVLEEIG